MPTENPLIFQESPEVAYATNLFVNVPVILQFDDTPIIELVQGITSSFEVSIPIFHEDGTDLGRYKGSRFFPTNEGRGAGVSLRHPDLMDVCELDGRTLFEIRRTRAAAISIQSELFAPNGYFMRCNDQVVAELLKDPLDESPFGTLGIRIEHSQFSNLDIGVWIKSSGSIGIGCRNPNKKVS